jgi:hypothetical protein
MAPGERGTEQARQTQDVRVVVDASPSLACGRIETAARAELKTLFELRRAYRDIVLDLKDVSLVGRDLMGFLVRCESDGEKLENCARYIREWREREKD